MPILRTLTAAVLLLAVLQASAESIYENVGRIVAVGDLHGDYEQYLQVLRDNDLIDKRLRWQGGDTHFVQMGDVTDRGPDSLKIIRHLMRLEKQAEKAGGRVHVLIGNHEAMNIQTDLRYVHPGEYLAFKSNKSMQRQKQYVDAVFRSMLKRQPGLMTQEKEKIAELEERYPLGYVEHRMHWEPGRELANWYAGQDAVIRINDSIFIHGGLDPHASSFPSLDDINEAVRAELQPGAQPKLTRDQRGPLWYRGLARHSAEEELVPLEAMLAHYQARRIFVAHSTTQGAVIPRFNAKVVLSDVGISAHYGASMANVVIDGDSVKVRHRGKLLNLPVTDDLKPYLREVAALEPEGSRLVKYVNSLESLED